MDVPRVYGLVLVWGRMRGGMDSQGCGRERRKRVSALTLLPVYSTAQYGGKRQVIICCNPGESGEEGSLVRGRAHECVGSAGGGG